MRATKKRAREGPLFISSLFVDLRPAGRAGVRPSLVVAIAAIDRLTAHGRERDFGRVTRHADHLAVTASAVSVAGSLPLVSAVLTALRLVGETALGIKRLLVLRENELRSAVRAVERLIVESVHGEPLISYG